MIFLRSCLTVSLIWISSTLLMGCGSDDGPERAAVSGTVTWNGESVEEGTITFIPVGQTKGQAAGDAIKGGKYAISASQGPVVGKHRVEIIANRKTGEKIKAVPPGTGEIDKLEQYIPGQFNSLSSTLERDVAKGKSSLNFDLTEK